MQKLTLKLLVLSAAMAITIAIAPHIPFTHANAKAVDPQVSTCCQDLWDPYWTKRGTWGPGKNGTWMNARMSRHWTFMNRGVSAEYRGASNPYSISPEIIDEGRALYTDNCASCHGKAGLGDGKQGMSLSPSPSLLAYLIQMPMAVDEYMIWTISEGGAEFETDMPAFKNKLPEEDIWKIVAYMRGGFPPI